MTKRIIGLSAALGLFAVPALANPPNTVNSSQKRVALEFVQFGGSTPGFECTLPTGSSTATPCTIYSGSPAILAVSHIIQEPGQYDITFAAGTFTAPPTCTFQANTAPIGSVGALLSVTETDLQIFFLAPNPNNNNLAPADVSASVICVGPSS